MSLSLIVISIYITSLSGYYLSPNSVTWPNASTFCQNYCNSHLVSIHSDDEYMHIGRIIDNSMDITDVFNGTGVSLGTNEVWIGLRDFDQNGTGTWSWSDGSLFNFANDTSGGVYPWRNGGGSSKEPNNWAGDEWCTHLWVDYSNAWNDNGCHGKYRFICNECRGKLSKYVFIHDRKSTYSNALSLCEDELGTSLASVHDIHDFALMAGLGSMVSDAAYWIGANDIDDEGNWKWTDGTSFDFGANLSGSVFPWSNNPGLNEPNNAGGGEDCVELRPDRGWEWNDRGCGPELTRSFLCNLPSEICTRFQDHWSILSGDLLFGYNSDNCMIHSDLHSLSVIENKIWTIDSQMWIVIDYMLTIHNAININNQDGKIGIVIFPFNGINAMCDYYFVGISINNNGGSMVFMEKHFNGTIETVQQASISTYMYGKYSKFRLEIMYHTTSNSILWTVLFGNFELNITESSLSDDLMGYNLHIGLRNDGMNISAKSLYISDPDDYVATGDIEWNECSSSPTNSPSIQPTADPTYDPTGDPTIDPTNNPTIMPSFDPTMDPTTDPSDDPTLEPTLQPSDGPTISPTNNPSPDPTYIPSINPVQEGGIPMETTKQNLNSTLNAIIEKPQTEDNIQLYIYFGIGIVILLVCIIVLLIIIYRRYYNQEKDPEPVSTNTTNHIELDNVVSSDANNSPSVPSEKEHAVLRDNNSIQRHDMTTIAMTERLTIGGMDPSAITPMGPVTAGNDEFNGETSKGQEKEATDENEGDSNTDENEKDMEDMYSDNDSGDINNAVNTPNFPRVVTDPGLNQQFKLQQ